jgi:Tfp pilus assembly protein PilO
VWAGRWRLWAPALAFFVFNLALALVYQIAYAGRVGALEAAVERREAELAEAQELRLAQQDLLDRADRNRDALGHFYGERLAPESERLTKVIAEVKELARRAGLDPATISYPEERLDEYRLVKKSFVFGVEGSYEELRQFVNLLELSPTLLALEQVTLTEAGQGGVLRINLRLAALFLQEDEAGVAAPGGEAAS